MADVIKYGIDFRWSTLYLIKKKHPGIDLFGINFIDWRAITFSILMMGVVDATEIKADPENGD